MRCSHTVSPRKANRRGHEGIGEGAATGAMVAAAEQTAGGRYRHGRGTAANGVPLWLDVLNNDVLEGLVQMKWRPPCLVRCRAANGTAPHPAGRPADIWLRCRVVGQQARTQGEPASLWPAAQRGRRVTATLRKLGFSRQQPERQAGERNEAAPVRWKKRSPPGMERSAARKADGSLSLTGRNCCSGPPGCAPGRPSRRRQSPSFTSTGSS